MNDERFKSITFQQMEALISLVKEGNFSRAAKKMLLTQPALTKNIKNMEDFLGVVVVNRSNAGISLTPEGTILYNYAERIIKLRDEAKTKIVMISKNTGGSIYISASTIPATYILPRILSEFKKEHPDIQVYIKTADSEEAMNMVLDKEVEIGFIGKKPTNKKLIAEPLWKDHLILAVPKGHRWRRSKTTNLSELLSEPFVIREKGSATRELFELCLKQSTSMNISALNICAELGSSEAIKEAIIAGLGVSAISIHAIKRELASGLLCEIPIAGLKMERNIYLLYPRHSDFRLSHKIFISFLQEFSKLNVGIV